MLTRRTPLRRKRPTPRRRGPECIRQRCHRPPFFEGLCRTHTRFLADSLMGASVRAAGRCERCGTSERLQWAHGFSRADRSTRYNPLNSFCLCAGCHYYFTMRPTAWTAWMQERLGEHVYEELRRLALNGPPPDYAAIIGGLRGR